MKIYNFIYISVKSFQGFGGVITRCIQQNVQIRKRWHICTSIITRDNHRRETNIRTKSPSIAIAEKANERSHLTTWMAKFCANSRQNERSSGGNGRGRYEAIEQTTTYIIHMYVLMYIHTELTFSPRLVWNILILFRAVMRNTPWNWSLFGRIVPMRIDLVNKNLGNCVFDRSVHARLDTMISSELATKGVQMASVHPSVRRQSLPKQIDFGLTTVLESLIALITHNESYKSLHHFKKW